MSAPKRASYRISPEDHQALKILAECTGYVYGGAGSPAQLMKAIARGKISLLMPSNPPQAINIKDCDCTIN